MKLLIIEDDKRTSQVLRRGLMEEAFSVDVLDDGLDGLEVAKAISYHLIVLDISLPGLDGWNVLKGIRQVGLQTPVLMLTARDSVADRVRGLELGADDYLVKPFAFVELVARIRSVLRRGAPKASEVLVYKDLLVDVRRHRVARNGVAIDLSTKELMLLQLLLERQGEVLSRTFIGEQVWDMNFGSDSNVVDVNIGRLRSKVDGPYAYPVIHTVRGRGYVLR
jgi:two-component system, OmpR family, copper resistance phosphate regulon response regulator CusR